MNSVMIRIKPDVKKKLALVKVNLEKKTYSEAIDYLIGIASEQYE